MINIDEVVSSIRESITLVDAYLREKDEVRELIIKSGRDVIRESGYVITSLHSRRLEDAGKHYSAMKDKYLKVTELASKYPELRNSGLYFNIASEYVEAALYYILIKEGRLPSISDLGVDPVPYVQGLLDLVGELKRRILDLVRDDKYDEAYTLFKVAEAIYESVRTLDYPDPILPGVRRKTDVARSVTESLRTLLTDLESRRRLMESLRKCESS